jgi:hypothetical protein
MALLEQIQGVQSSAAVLGVDGGPLVQVVLRPGADAAKVATEVQRVLSQQVKERTSVRLEGQAATAAIGKKEWLSSNQVTSLAAAVPVPPAAAPPAAAPPERTWPWTLAWLLPLGLVTGLGLLWLRRRTLAGRTKPMVLPGPRTP